MKCVPTFSLFAARAVQKLEIPPIPAPQPCQHFPIECVLSQRGRDGTPKPKPDRSVRRCSLGLVWWIGTRSILAPVHGSNGSRQSAAFRSSEGAVSVGGQTYESFQRHHRRSLRASAVSCMSSLL